MIKTCNFFTIITSDMKWNKNTERIVKNANSKMRMLHIASKFIRNRNDLLHIYKTFIRSRLKYSCVLWHSSLSKTNENDIERVQKAALKVILKKDYGCYENALKLLDIESLFDRRSRLCLKFAKKCLKLENFKKLFPYNETKHKMKKRIFEKYLVQNVSTERHKNSAINAMRKMLNEEELKLQRAMKSFDIVPRELRFLNSISVKI